MHFLGRNFRPLGYLYSVAQYALWSNTRFCQQKSFCAFLLAKTYALMAHILRTQSTIRSTTYTVRHHTNIQADKNFRTKMRKSQKSIRTA